eukprot:gb/GECG01003009.1/.p1 GENE.gb/GECG01003009.1/~~gb/GECG01003009.1/.p1  ORF type:complete len:106 (+),score=9.26 gb/GECG01003009.1/:1-318(+)
MMQSHSFRRVDWFSEASALLQVFTGAISQEDVYKESVAPLVDSLIEGTSTTVITYGPSGSGKLSIQTCKSLRLRLATCLLLRILCALEFYSIYKLKMLASAASAR